MTTLTLART